MVIRGRSLYVHGVPRRRRPDWDSTVHDLHILKLTPAELDARSKAFKSKDWTCSPPKRSPSTDKVKAGDADRNKSIMSRASKEAVMVKSTRSSDEDDDDFDEDIRRLESLQMQRPRFTNLHISERERNNEVGVRGSPNLLQYLEMEMHKAWFEICTAKAKHRPKHKKIKKRMKLQIRRKKVPSEANKVLNMILANQKSTAISTNESFIQELKSHVIYQQKVIQELNEFRISATKELSNLVELVQKMLSIQQSKAPVVDLPESDDGINNTIVEAKDTSLVNKIDSTTYTPNGIPPKPREVPTFLKQRLSMVHQPQPRLQLQGASFSAEKAEPTQGAKPIENKRRLPSCTLKQAHEVAHVDQASHVDEFDRRENPLFESEKCIAIQRGPFKKSRVHEHPTSPAWKGEGTQSSKEVEAIPCQGQKTSTCKPISTFISPTLNQVKSSKPNSPSISSPTCKPSNTSALRPYMSCKGNVRHQRVPTFSEGVPTHRPSATCRAQLVPTFRSRDHSNAAREDRSTTCILPARKPEVARKQPAVDGKKLTESQAVVNGPRYKLQGWSASIPR